jgi:hypothetical protein
VKRDAPAAAVRPLDQRAFPLDAIPLFQQPKRFLGPGDVGVHVQPAALDHLFLLKI